MPITTSNLLAHAPELHSSNLQDESETTATENTEPALEPDTEEVGDRPPSPSSKQTIKPVKLQTIPQKKLIPNLETTFGGISFLAILITPILLLTIARPK